MACVPKWAWPRCKAETDLPRAAFVLGARSPPAFWLQPAPDFPAASRARGSLQRWEKIPGLRLWSLGEPRRLAFWRTCSLGLPCPRAVTVVPTARPPLRGMACTYYTVICTHSEDVDVAMGPVQHIHSSVCRTTVARYTHTLHTHTLYTHTLNILTCAPALHSHTPAEAKPSRFGGVVRRLARPLCCPECTPFPQSTMGQRQGLPAKGTVPSGHPVPAAAPQGSGGMGHFLTGSRKRPPWVSRQKSFMTSWVLEPAARLA